MQTELPEAPAAITDAEADVTTLLRRVYEQGYEAGRRAGSSAQGDWGQRLVNRLCAGRFATFQISVATLAHVAGREGLYTDLPDLATSGLEAMWRQRLREDLCGRTWTRTRGLTGRKRWRVGCPQGGNFRFEPGR